VTTCPCKMKEGILNCHLVNMSANRGLLWFLFRLSFDQGPLSLLSAIEVVLERKSSGSGLETRKYGRRDSSRLPRDNLYPQKFTLISPTSATDFFSPPKLRPTNCCE
jgi:hypothetical protein